MVAMNAETFEEDIASIKSRADTSFYDNSKELGAPTSAGAATST